ncbi:TadE/TadG family type IV pilus assembly protein [Sphingomonas donggukensis]
MRRLRTFARRLRADTGGLALLEFAFILPIFLVLSLTGAELTNYVITRMRISQLALQIADNAARIGSGSQLQAKTISETDINDLLTGAGLQGGELDLYPRGRVMISSLEPMTSPNVAKLYKIAWQRCRGTKTYDSPYDNTLTNISSGIGPTGRKVTAPDNGAVMFVEVAYDYKPLVKTSLSPSSAITEFASMMVRDRRDTSKIYNTENATKSTC